MINAYRDFNDNFDCAISVDVNNKKEILHDISEMPLISDIEMIEAEIEYYCYVLNHEIKAS